MQRVFKALFFLFFILVKNGLLAQELYPNCVPHSQKVESWNKCFGRYIFPNGIEYIGEWSGDMANGIGMLTYPNQYKYVGHFENDKELGTGALLDTSGSIVKAGYANSPSVDQQNYRAAISYITSEELGMENVRQYIKYVQSKLSDYLNRQNIKSPATNTIDSSSNRLIKNTPSVSQSSLSDSKLTLQKRKCMRLGLSLNSDDFKLCMQQ